MLGGGDLDGYVHLSKHAGKLNPARSDLYSIIKYSPLLPTEHAEPGSYEPVGTRTLDRDATVEDICDFIVEYINSDVLVGVLTNILLNFFFSKSFDSVM